MKNRTGNGSKPGKFTKTVLNRPEGKRPSIKKSDAFQAEIMSIRPCGDCQECCHAVAVHEIGKGEYETCRHQCSTGCGIYARRPGSCRVYACAWKVGMIVPAAPLEAVADGIAMPILGGPTDADRPDVAALRPDRLGAVIDIDRAIGTGQGYIRVWQSRGPEQMQAEPALRRHVWTLADALSLPVFAYHAGSARRSIWLVPRLIPRWAGPLAKRYPGFPIFELKREELPMD